jgi:hypothetical protein
LLKFTSISVILVVIVLAGLALPSVLANNLAQQFWLPGEADGNCHMQSITLKMVQGGGISGTVVSDQPIYVMVLTSAQYQGISNDSNACTDLTTMGFVNSGPTTNYQLLFTAPYTAMSGSPFIILFVNVGASNADVTINLTTFMPGQ